MLVLIIGETLYVDGADLLFKVLEELLKGGFDSFLHNKIWRGRDFTLNLSLSFVSKQRPFWVVSQQNDTGGLDRTERTGRLGNVDNARPGVCYGRQTRSKALCPILQEDIIGAFQAGKIRRNAQLELATCGKIHKFSAITAGNAVFKNFWVEQRVKYLGARCFDFLISCNFHETCILFISSLSLTIHPASRFFPAEA